MDAQTAKIEVVTGALDRPIGICFSPDWKNLCVRGTGTPRDIQVFMVAGNIWAGASGGAGYHGVHVFSPEGQRIGMILLLEICANICFGAASQSLYPVEVETQGAHIT